MQVQSYFSQLDNFEGELATLNLGPTHPATHGIFQNVLKMDGEKIVSAEPTIGYIHRAFEKLAERRPFNQVTPITDRLNYCSSPINNMGWHMTVEKLAKIELPKRAQYMRIIIMELSRIADHLICNSVLGVDTGALTGFLTGASDRFSTCCWSFAVVSRWEITRDSCCVMKSRISLW